MSELRNPKLEELARSDPRQIVEKLFYIVDKSGQKVPFIFNPTQAKFYEGRSPRDDVLKARKEGLSSAVLALFTVKFLFVPNSVCMCVSHLEEDTTILLDKVRYFIENLPFEVKLDLDSKGHLRLNEMNTDFYIATAGSKTKGRGGTPHYLHLSEFAFYPSWTMVTGLINSVPDDLKNTWIIKETTANGYGNPHHQAWIEEIKGDSVFKPHFFPWFDSPEYQMSLKEDTTFSAEERLLQEKYNLTDEQIYWRQWKIRSQQPTQDYDKETLFRQEYPSSWVEAFISTGRPFFDPATLDWYDQAICMAPLKRGYLMGFNPPTLLDDSLGALRVYKLPEPGRTYVIGGDTASGEGSDYSALVVLDRESMEEVALWWGKAEEFEMAQVAFRLGSWYNTALIGIERNNMGIAVVRKLDELGYTNQYRMEEMDEMGRKVRNKLGWETNSKTRPIMMSDLLQAINERQLIVRSLEIIGECRSLIRAKEGRPEAQQGTHDDLVMATAVAMQMYKSIPGGVNNDEVVVRRYSPNTTISNFSTKNNGKRHS